MTIYPAIYRPANAMLAMILTLPAHAGEGRNPVPEDPLLATSAIALRVNE